MTAGKDDLYIEGGCGVSLVFQWLEDDGVTPTNLTGGLITFVIRATPTGPALMTLTTGGGGVTWDAATGTIDIESTLDQEAALHLTGGVYFVDVTMPGAKPDRLLWGGVIRSPNGGG